MSRDSVEGFMRILMSKSNNPKEKQLLRRALQARQRTAQLGPIIIVDEEGNECQINL